MSSQVRPERRVDLANQNAPARTVDFELTEIRPSIPNLPDDVGPVVFDPGRGASQRVQEPLDMTFPGTEGKVEVVLTVAATGPSICLR